MRTGSQANARWQHRSPRDRAIFHLSPAASAIGCSGLSGGGGGARSSAERPGRQRRGWARRCGAPWRGGRGQRQARPKAGQVAGRGKLVPSLALPWRLGASQTISDPPAARRCGVAMLLPKLPPGGGHKVTSPPSPGLSGASCSSEPGLATLKRFKMLLEFPVM